jgi:hypothetical protein
MNIELHRLCNGWLRFGRPDRGPEERCTNRAKFRTVDGPMCGVHARAYRDPVRIP